MPLEPDKANNSHSQGLFYGKLLSHICTTKAEIRHCLVVTCQVTHFLAEAQKPIPVSLKRIIVISAVIGYAALIVYLLYFVGVGDLFSTLEKVNFGIYAIAIGAVILSIAFHTLVWLRLLNYLSIKIGFRRLFTFYWVGIFVDNLIPGGWSRDLFKAYLLSKK